MASFEEFSEKRESTWKHREVTFLIHDFERFDAVGPTI